MKRRMLWISLVGGAVVLGSTLAGLSLATRATPDFYEAALANSPAPDVREEAARAFAEQTAQLVEEIRYARTWEQEFTQTQVNAWLAEELPRRYGRKLPRGFSDPRVQFADDLVQIGFRYASKQFAGVISLGLRPSVPLPNQIDLTVVTLNAGVLPLSPRNFTADITKQLDRYGVSHAWSETDGLTVLSVAIEPTYDDRPVLEEIEVQSERLRITGHREQPTVLTQRHVAGPTRL